MATTASERRSRVVEALGFWFITLVICAAAGLGSYRFGRQWIGDRLGGDVKSVLTSNELASRVSDEAFGGDVPDGADVPEEPPAKAIVQVEEADLSVQDRQKLRLDKAREARESASREEGADEGDAEDEARADADEKPAERVRDEKPATPPAERPTARPAARSAERPGPSAPVRPETQGQGDHVVRAGSFTQGGNADRLVDELRSKGYQPFVTETVVDGVTYHRVNVARYNDREKAFELRRELRTDGYPAEISSE